MAKSLFVALTFVLSLLSAVACAPSDPSPKEPTNQRAEATMERARAKEEADKSTQEAGFKDLEESYERFLKDQEKLSHGQIVRDAIGSTTQEEVNDLAHIVAGASLLRMRMGELPEEYKAREIGQKIMKLDRGSALAFSQAVIKFAHQGDARYGALDEAIKLIKEYDFTSELLGLDAQYLRAALDATAQAEVKRGDLAARWRGEGSIGEGNPLALFLLEWKVPPAKLGLTPTEAEEIRELLMNRG